jgi:hypothetical protein
MPQCELHFKNQSSPNFSIHATITISTNPVPINIYFSILDNLDSDLSLTDQSNTHSRNQLSLKTSTDFGITTNLRLVFQNTLASIASKIDTFSNTTN